MEIKEKLLIHCYKHNGKIHRTWGEAVVLEETADCLVCANDKVKVVEDDGRSHRTNEPAIMFFYKKRWFNIIAQLKPFGLFYYCNIASPYTMDGKIIKYIDYDLDLRVFPDGGFRVLDKNEYKYHKKLMHYSEEIDFIVKKELESLINMKKNNEGPFDENTIEHYYNIYKDIEKSKN